MNLLEHPIGMVRRSFHENYTATMLKTLIVLWALFMIVLVLFFINDKWLLAGILAYEILP